MVTMARLGMILALAGWNGFTYIFWVESRMVEVLQTACSELSEYWACLCQFVSVGRSSIVMALTRIRRVLNERFGETWAAAGSP
jgi:hypothetical protein